MYGMYTNAGTGAPKPHARMVDEAGGTLDEYIVIYMYILSVFLYMVCIHIYICIYIYMHIYVYIYIYILSVFLYMYYTHMLRAENAGAGAPNPHARMVDEAGGALGLSPLRCPLPRLRQDRGAADARARAGLPEGQQSARG